MRRRQLKKFAKSNDGEAYKQAMSRGSKKLCRRWKTMCRYWPYGGARIDRYRIAALKMGTFMEDLKNSPVNVLMWDKLTKVIQGIGWGEDETW